MDCSGFVRYHLPDDGGWRSLLSVRYSGDCPAGPEEVEYVQKGSSCCNVCRGGSVAYGTLIGMPNALNIAPTTYLGTTTMAGPVISLICTAFSVVFIVAYLMLLTTG